MPLLEDFAVDSQLQLRPSRVLCIGVQGAMQQIFRVGDVTDITLSSNGQKADECLATPDFDALQSCAAQMPSILDLHKKSPLSSEIRVEAPSGATVVELSCPLLSFGKWSLLFPSDSPHSSHTIEMKPVSRGEGIFGFAQESVPYFWHMVDEGWQKRCILWKVVGEGRRAEVARFVAKRLRDKGGIMAVDGIAVDWVVAVATCVALLNRVASFEK